MHQTHSCVCGNHEQVWLRFLEADEEKIPTQKPVMAIVLLFPFQLRNIPSFVLFQSKWRFASLQMFGQKLNGGHV